MRERYQKKGLTTIKIYWIEDQNGCKSFRDYSWDRRADIRKLNKEPGMDRLYEKFVKPNIGKFYTVEIYENQFGGKLLRKYDQDGNLIYKHSQ